MSISEYLNSLFSDWTTVIKGAAAFVALAGVVITAIKSRMAWAAILISILVAALLVWAVTMNGLGWFSDGIKNETNNVKAAGMLLQYALVA